MGDSPPDPCRCLVVMPPALMQTTGHDGVSGFAHRLLDAIEVILTQLFADVGPLPAGDDADIVRLLFGGLIPKVDALEFVPLAPVEARAHVGLCRISAEESLVI